MELQHINVKLLLRDPEAVDLSAAIPVFHSWIQEQVCDELLLDVADYQHVESGPGVVLIGHEADYSLDNVDGRLGIRYNRKAAIEGNNQDRFGQAVTAVLHAAQRLESDPHLKQSIKVSGREIEVWINDRALVPNNDASRNSLEAELRAFLGRLFASTAYSLSFEKDPRRLLHVRIRPEVSFTTAELLENLGQPEIA